MSARCEGLQVLVLIFRCGRFCHSYRVLQGEPWMYDATTPAAFAAQGRLLKRSGYCSSIREVIRKQWITLDEGGVPEA